MACAGLPPRTADFRVRTDSIATGDLLGPFRGRVVDGDTGSPISGAVVYATWSLRSGYSVTLPAGHLEHVTNTDADGNYTIPAVDSPSSDGRITDFYLVIYKRGYVAYRSDRRFDDFGPRRDFAQENNQVTLERWRSELSHARHLRYVGGGDALTTLTAWEVEEAAAELSNPDRTDTAISAELLPAAPRMRVAAARLIDPDEVKAITGYEGRFESGPLGDEPDTASYSSQHLKAQGLPETYDIALRVWQLDTPDAADARYVELSETLPQVEETTEVADRALRATENAIYGFGFLDRRRSLVVLLTCGRNQCASADTAAQLGIAVHERIQSLWPRPSGTPRAAPASPKPAQGDAQ